MQRYVMNPKPATSVKVYGRGLRISAKSSKILCKALTGLALPRGEKLLEDLLTQKRSLSGKYYTNVTKQLLLLLKSAEANTEFKGLSPERMFIHASTHEGFTFATPRRFKQRGKRRNVTHVQLILQQR